MDEALQFVAQATGTLRHEWRPLEQVLSTADQTGDDTEQAAAAGAITERLGKLHGFAFDPIKQGEPPSPTTSSKPESVIDFKLVNKRYSMEPT